MNKQMSWGTKLPQNSCHTSFRVLAHTGVTRRWISELESTSSDFSFRFQTLNFVGHIAGTNSRQIRVAHMRAGACRCNMSPLHVPVSCPLMHVFTERDVCRCNGLCYLSCANTFVNQLPLQGRLGSAFDGFYTKKNSLYQRLWTD